MSEHYNSHKALNSPPHITLVPPFRLYEKDEMVMSQMLKEFFLTRSSFELTLNGFRAFPPRVIYVHNAPQPMLIALEKQSRDFLKGIYPGIYKGRSYNFNPHMTIAYKDLSEESFLHAWAEFSRKEYRAVFEVKDIAFLKHNLKRWETIHSLPLSG